MTKQELQEKRAKLAKQIREKGEAFNANGKKWKDDSERSNFQTLNTDYNAVLAELRELTAAEEVDNRMREIDEHDERSNTPDNKPGMDDVDSQDESRNDERRQERRAERRDRQRTAPDEETRSLAMAGFLRGQCGMRMTEQHTRAMGACGYFANQRHLEFANPNAQWFRAAQQTWNGGHHSDALSRTLEARALSSITAATGGVLVPATFIRSLEVNMLAYGGMLQVARIVTTTDGGTLTMPTADDTGNTGSRLGESTVPTGTAQPSFGGVQWSAYKYTSNPVLVPNELLEDAFIDLPGFLADALAERIGRVMNTDFTLGDGANKPKGIITCASNGRTSGTANAIGYDDVIYLEHSIDPAYRPGCQFMGHDNTALAMRLLKDGNNRYLWSYGVDAGKPDTLDGKPFTINQDMASTIATGTKPLLYGRFDKYIIRRVGPNRFYHLQERYREYDQDGFLAFVRADGNLLNAGTGTVKYITIS